MYLYLLDSSLVKKLFNENQLIMPYHVQAESRLRYGLGFWYPLLNLRMYSHKNVIRSIDGYPQTTRSNSYIFEVFLRSNLDRLKANNLIHDFNRRQSTDLHILSTKCYSVSNSPSILGQRIYNKLHVSF